MKFIKKLIYSKTTICILTAFSITILSSCEQNKFALSSEYLDIDANNFAEMSEKDFHNLGLAFERLNYGKEDGKFDLKYTSELNISEEMFDVVENLINNGNKVIESYELITIDKPVGSSGLIRLQSSAEGDQQGGTSSASSDCMAHSISNLSGDSYSTVNNYLTGTYGSNGVPFNSFGEAVSHFFPTGTFGDASSLNAGFLNNAIIVYGINDSTSHVRQSHKKKA